MDRVWLSRQNDPGVEPRDCCIALGALLLGHIDTVMSVVVSPDGKCILSDSSGCVMRVLARLESSSPMTHRLHSLCCNLS